MSTVEKDVVTLTFFESKYIPLLEGYHLHEEQKRYTAMPLDALKSCELEADRHPVAILYGSQLAGFFVLHGWEGVRAYSDNKDAILLRAYSVSSSFQGKGIGWNSISMLTDFVKEHFPHKQEIILGVNHANIIAQRLYLNAGFIDKGIRVIGRQGEMLILHKEL
jgi:RimJ/RimL family protein N-acetyltransferase